MMPYPLHFRPILKRRVWGGRSLERFGKTLPAGESIGESWELADLPPEIEEGQSIIANGPLAGATLHEVLEGDAEVILGSTIGGAFSSRRPSTQPPHRFPLLIKYLDAQENLSVQVHPDKGYIAAHPEAHLKDEVWIVIDHMPGAVIYKGLREGLDEQTLRARIDSGEIVDDLGAIAVERGQCHYLPSGTVHALGAGVLVAEVQTPSDTTFRMYDWGRTSRKLHIDQAMEVLFPPEARHAEPPARALPHDSMTVGNVRTTCLLEAERFTIERVEALAEALFEIVTNNMPEVWMIIEDGGRIDGDVPVTLSKGTTLLIPAAMPEVAAILREGTMMLRITLPSPLKGMIA